MFAVGENFTTAKSGVTGTIQEVVYNPQGTYRIRLATPNGDRWTTAQ
jgi:hypothetical protein